MPRNSKNNNKNYIFSQLVIESKEESKTQNIFVNLV